MQKGYFTYEEIQSLRGNSNVQNVVGNRITYTTAFKIHFVEEYNLGKSPTQIFREAGFDINILGYKRVERATANWKAAYAANKLSMEQEEKRSQSNDEQLLIVKLTQEIKDLKEQVEKLHTLLDKEITSTEKEAENDARK